MCLCAGTGRYRVSVESSGHRRIIERVCDCEVGADITAAEMKAETPPTTRKRRRDDDMTGLPKPTRHFSGWQHFLKGLP